MNIMFYECYALKELDVSMFNTSNVKNMGQMFFNCRNIEKLNVSSFDTGSISGTNTSRNSGVHDMFTEMPKLKEITLGEQFDFKKGQSEIWYALLPTPTGSKYTGKWIRDDMAYGPFTPEELRDQYTSAMAGTWIWEETPDPDHVKCIFHPNNGSTDTQKVLADVTDEGGEVHVESVRVPSIPTRPGYIFMGWDVASHQSTETRQTLIRYN